MEEEKRIINTLKESRANIVNCAIDLVEMGYHDAADLLNGFQVQINKTIAYIEEKRHE